jgi:hypothetical protein
LASALLRLQARLRPGSHLLLTVDGRSLDEAAISALESLQQHHDLVVAIVVDPMELQAPPPGHYPVSDGMGHGWLDIDVRGGAERWRLLRQQLGLDARDRLCRLGIAARWVRTDEDPVEALGDLLRGVRQEAA